MPNMYETLTQQLGGPALGQLARQLGASEKSTGAAVSVAVPVLLSALARNAASSQGAQSLASALERDHDGNVLNDLAGFLGRSPGGSASGILGHLFGARTNEVSAQLGHATGLDAATAGRLLQMLAPIALGALGKAKKEGGLDASGLAALLGGEQEGLRRSAPGALGLVGRLLDANADGSIVDDVARIGGGLLGSLLGGKKA